MTLINALEAMDGDMIIKAWISKVGEELPVYEGRVKDIKLGCAAGHSVLQIRPKSFALDYGEVGIEIELSK